MKVDRFAKVMLVLIFLALLANMAVYIFAPRPSVAQVPEVLIAQATERVAEANGRVARAIELLADRIYVSNLKIADAVERSARR